MQDRAASSSFAKGFAVQLFVFTLRLTILLPFIGIYATWWVCMLPFSLLGAMFGGSGRRMPRVRTSRTHRYTVVGGKSGFRSYTVTRD